MEWPYDEKTALRFWAKVDVKSDEDVCWLWTRRIESNGYGRFGANSKVKFGTHVYAWISANQAEVPKGMHVMHSCANKHCCNPKHLSVGTPVQNMAERQERLGPYQRRVSNLSEEDRKEIREMYVSGFINRDLAEMYNSSTSVIARITKGTKRGVS